MDNTKLEKEVLLTANFFSKNMLALMIDLNEIDLEFQRKIDDNKHNATGKKELVDQQIEIFKRYSSLGNCMKLASSRVYNTLHSFISDPESPLREINYNNNRDDIDQLIDVFNRAKRTVEYSQNWIDKVNEHLAIADQLDELKHS